MAKKTSLENSSNDHKKSGFEEKDYDPWFYENCRLVNRACDNFWTLTAERVRLNELYYKSRLNKYGY